MLKRGYDAMRAYSQSKLAQIMFTFELAERLSGTGVSVNALHPASLMDTKMVQDTFGYNMSTVEEGTEAVVRLTVSPELELPSIGWQLFILDRSQSDPKALPAFLDTYATRLLTEPLSRSENLSLIFPCRPLGSIHVLE